jgi:hypothetical protein
MNIDTPTAKPPAKRRGPIQVSDEEREEKVQAAINSKRYHLVQSGRLWGCYDGVDATQVLFPSRTEAENYMWDLVHGRDAFKLFYSGGKRHD